MGGDIGKAFNSVGNAVTGGVKSLGSLGGGLGGIGNGVFQVADNLLGTNMSGNSATSQALDAQLAATREANALQQYMYDTSRKDNEPWRQAGTSALSSLQDPNFGKNLTMDPGYQFRLAEGNKAINNSAAARGMHNSGATMKALQRYGQDFASNEYNNAYNRQYNRLSALAGIGQQANAQNQASSTNYANQTSNNLMGYGNAQGAAHMSNANRLSDLVGTLGGAALGRGQ